MKLSLVFLVCVATTILAVQAEKENTRAGYKEIYLKTLEVVPVNDKPKIPSLAPQRAIQKKRVALRKPFVATPEEREKRQTEAELRFIARQHSSDDDERMAQLVTAILLKNYPADQETISNALKAAKVEIGALFKDDRMIEVLHLRNVAPLAYIIEAVRVARKQLDLGTAISTGKRCAVTQLLQDKAGYPERSLQNLVDKVPMSGPDGFLILRNLLTRFDDPVNLEPSMDAAVQNNDMELLMFLLNDKRADSAILSVFRKAVSNDNAAAIEVFIRSDKIKEDDCKEPGFELALEIFQDAELQKVTDVLEMKEMNYAIERKDMERLKSLVDDNLNKSLLLDVFRNAVRNKKKAAIKLFIRSGKITEVDCREPGLEFAREIYQVLEDAEVQKIAEDLEVRTMEDAIGINDMERLKSLVNDDNLAESVLLRVFRNAVRHENAAVIKVFIGSRNALKIILRKLKDEEVRKVNDITRATQVV